MDTEPCKICTNKPDHSNYIYDSNDQCAYECDPGHQGESCLTPFMFFVSGMGGLTVFSVLVVIIGCVKYRFLSLYLSLSISL